jgi:AcrR family transcriptional regulator
VQAETLLVRKGEATRSKILGEAERLAAVRGLSAVSLNDVAEASGLSKSGVFKHFDSKEAMQEAVLVHATDRFMAFVWAPAGEKPPGRARLETVFDRWLDWSEVENAASGCLIMAASVELDDQPGPLRDLLQERLGIWLRMLVKEMRALADPPLSIQEARAAVFQMQSFILGHAQAGRLMGDRDARSAARAAFAALLDRTAGSGLR